ncbi:MAG: ABC-type phosphate transport system permease subunit, partial [Planctomycetota bacterium]
MPTHQAQDRLLLWSLRAAAFLTASIVVLIVVFLLLESGPGLREVGLGR